MYTRRKFLTTTATGLGAAYLTGSTKLLAAESVPDAKLAPPEGAYTPATPHYIFAETLKEQEAQLKNNPLMRRFAESRRKLASDPYRPVYHFVCPEGGMNDPSGLSFWQGRWHMLYQSHAPDSPDGGGKGHAVSDDLVHWRDLPYALYPGIEPHLHTGSTMVEKDRVIIFYPGEDTGIMVATSHDPLLLNWEKSGPVITGEKSYKDYWDGDIWKEGDTYYGLVGGNRKYYPESTVTPERLGPLSSMFEAPAVWPKTALWTSKDLKNWQPAGELLFEHTPFTRRFDDGSCLNFQKIGQKTDNKYILLFFSHQHGGQYLLGDYNEKTHKFRPYDHGRFNHGAVLSGGVHAPSAVEDGKGGVINILNMNPGIKSKGWFEGQLMTLPQHLTLGKDKRLRIEPVKAVASLRSAHQHVGKTVIPTNRDLILENIQGNTMELDVEIDTRESGWVQLNILRSPGAEEQTSIIFYNLQTPDGLYLDGLIKEKVVLDASRSTIRNDIWLRPPEQADVNRNGENLKLRVFIDRSVVEVFVNNRQYVAMRVYPGRKDSLGVSLRAHGQDAVLKKLDAWQMKPIWPVATSSG